MRIKFSDANELKGIINDFYEYCKQENKVITITGLCYFLGISRKTFNNYLNNDNEVFKTISKNEQKEIRYLLMDARLKIESEYEQLLFKKTSTTGSIFTLKNNFDWIDKQEISSTNENNNSIALSDYSKEELKDIVSKLMEK